MIENFILKNMDTSKSLQFGRTFGYAFILEDNGLNWGNTPASHSSVTNLTGSGEIITNTVLKPRDISVTGRICSRHTNKEIAEIYRVSAYEEILAIKQQEIEAACEELSSVVNPQSEVQIQIGKFFIEGKPSGSIKISSSWDENNEVYKKFTFSIECPDPMFYQKSVSNVPLSGVRGGFHFPLHIPVGTGMHFGIKIPYQLISVQNTSDITVGIQIVMKAKGTLINPSITNVYTQETIQINKTLSEGEQIIIDTVKRTVKGSVSGGSMVSYLGYWDWDNDWFQLPSGYSLFGFSAEDETYRNMELSFLISPCFTTIGGE